MLYNVYKSFFSNFFQLSNTIQLTVSFISRGITGAMGALEFAGICQSEKKIRFLETKFLQTSA